MLEQTIKMARRYEKRFCVMFLDLDGSSHQRHA